jgi:hypothetical protein
MGSSVSERFMACSFPGWFMAWSSFMIALPDQGSFCPDVIGKEHQIGINVCEHSKIRYKVWRKLHAARQASGTGNFHKGGQERWFPGQAVDPLSVQRLFNVTSIARHEPAGRWQRGEL